MRSLILLLLSILLLGCTTQSQPQSSPVTQPNQTVYVNLSYLNSGITEKADKIIVTDDFGCKVAVKKYPQRIVSLAPSNTEILFALGLGSRVVGVTDYCNYPPEVVKLKEEGKIESVGGFSTINVEKVIALKPDLVVGAYGNGLGNIEAIRQFEIPVICFNPKNLKDVMRDIWILGVLTGEKQNAAKLIQFMEDKINHVEEIVKRADTKPKVVHILWNDPIWVSGRETFVDELIRLAGGENAVKKKDWTVISIEELIRLNPDVIIVNSGNGMGDGRNILYEWVMHDERLKDINAVKNGRVYVVDADVVSRPSYRLVYALEEFARFIHPELFEEVEVYRSTFNLSYADTCISSSDRLCNCSTRTCS